MDSNIIIISSSEKINKKIKIKILLKESGNNKVSAAMQTS
jgi:hypothetical protein